MNARIAVVSTPSHRSIVASAVLAALAIAATLVLGVSFAGAVAPVVTIEPATAVRYTTAHAEGKVNPGDHETSFHFEYVTEAQFAAGGWAEAGPSGQVAGFGSVGAGEPAVEPTAELTGLIPGTTYHLRLLAENSEAERVGAIAPTFETEAVTKPSLTIAPVPGSPVSTPHLSGTVDPSAPGGPLDEATANAYRTAWHFQCEPTSCGETLSGAIEADPTSHEFPAGAVTVEGEATGLQPNTTYHVKLMASNAGGAEEATESGGEPVEFTTPAVAPVVTAVGSAPLGAGAVGLGAFVTSGNSAVTDCTFEYGTTASYGQSAPCTQGEYEPLGTLANNQPDLVKARLTGLTPGGTYHVRLSVTTQAGGTVQGKDSPFTAPVEGPTLPCPNAGSVGVGFLPDCRAWEMVSPPIKNGGNVATMPEFTRVKGDGNAVGFSSTTSFGDASGAGGNGTDYIASREAGGWRTHAITPLQVPEEFPGFSAGYVSEYSPDFTRGVFLAPAALTPGHPNVEGAWNLYRTTDLQGTPDPASMDLLSDASAPVVVSSEHDVFPTISYVGASDDFSHILFESVDDLTPDTQPQACTERPSSCRAQLYEWANGTLRLAGILPDSACATPPCTAEQTLAGAGVGGMGSAGIGRTASTYATNAISDDGSRIFFEGPPFAEAFGIGGFSGNLYMREDGTRTVQLNLSERNEPDPAGPQLATFDLATPDGSQVFFTTKEELVDEDTDSKIDIYRYDVDAPVGEHLSLISHDAEPADGDTGNNLFITGASDDGKYVYFATNSMLLSGQPSLESVGAATLFLYVWHEGTIRLIGYRDHDGDATWGENRVDFAFRSSFRTTPDGRHAVFVSANHALAASLGYDNTNPEGGGNEKGCQAGNESGGGSDCQEVYVYDYASDRLSCASCDPSRTPPVSDAGFVNIADNSLSQLQLTLKNTIVSNDGRYVFFNTYNPLVARDTNGHLDAYEYDTRSGEVGLISSGQCNCNSYFVGTDPSGQNAFFTTGQRLVRIDKDNNVDLYDARVGGGIAAQNAEPPAECEGDSCLPPPGAPNDAGPSSASFAGPGDPAARHRSARRCRSRKGKGAKARDGKRAAPRHKSACARAKHHAGRAK